MIRRVVILFFICLVFNFFNASNRINPSTVLKMLVKHIPTLIDFMKFIKSLEDPPAYEWNAISSLPHDAKNISLKAVQRDPSWFLRPVAGMQHVYVGQDKKDCDSLPIDKIKTYWRIDLVMNEKDIFDRLVLMFKHKRLELEDIKDSIGLVCNGFRNEYKLILEPQYLGYYQAYSDCGYNCPGSWHCWQKFGLIVNIIKLKNEL